MRRALVAVVAAVALCAGCSGGNTAPPPAGVATTAVAAQHNAVDLEFVRALIPSHQAGIALAKAAAADPRAKILADAIVATEQDEITRMNGWLTTWGVPKVEGAASAAPAVTGDAAIRALMDHQNKATELAQKEQAQGSNPTALAFATQVIQSRTEQVTQLRGYLGGGHSHSHPTGS